MLNRKSRYHRKKRKRYGKINHFYLQIYRFIHFKWYNNLTKLSPSIKILPKTANLSNFEIKI